MPYEIRYAGSIPRAYIVQHMTWLEPWANTIPINPSNETNTFGGVVLIRRIWDNYMNVAPVGQMDVWMLHRWDDGFVGDPPNLETLKVKL